MNQGDIFVLMAFVMVLILGVVLGMLLADAIRSGRFDKRDK